MKAFVKPTGLHSYAMVRVANALKQYAPSHVECVDDPMQADFRVLHVIGHGSFDDVDLNVPHALIQYCLRSVQNGWNPLHWLPAWERAKLVFSYYDLNVLLNEEVCKNPMGFGEARAAWSRCKFYHAPLGVDQAFVDAHSNGQTRDIGVMTSGYVSAPHAEAIEEVAMAADARGMSVVHLGPGEVEGMRVVPPKWKSVSGIDDAALSALYLRSEWVSCLRHLEGFELPALEGLMCGARPICFDRVDMVQWYGEHAAFVPECHGLELVDHLMTLMNYKPKPVSEAERAQVAARFDWKKIAEGFWERAIS